jgi:DNA-binding NarL/FixJ family response regulator
VSRPWHDGSVPDHAAVEAGRLAAARGDWAAAFEALTAADADHPLAADDLELLGLAAFLTGRDAESDAARERAHHAHLDAGDIEPAVRAAYWLALALTLRGEPARGGGWFGRCQSVLDDSGLADSVWRGFLAVPPGMRAFFAGDYETALTHLERAQSIADRSGDLDLRVLCLNGKGQAQIRTGDVTAGLATLDELMVTVTSTPGIYPQVVGLMYCASIDACRDLYDVRRGREWTAALTRWCDAQPGLVPYRGQCLVHRSELMQLLGSWRDATTEVTQVCAEVDSGIDAATMPVAGLAFYQRAELHRLRGEYDDAEERYCRALQVGHDPQPGLSLLRLARGQPDTAYAAIRRALDETVEALRPRLLPGYAEIALAVDDIPAAAKAAAELVEVATTRGMPLLTAASLHATGAVQLAEGDSSRALATLRQAWTAWQDIAAPYDAARTRVLVALACRAMGDDDTAEMELDAARWVFDELGAAPDVARATKLSRRQQRAQAPGGLTVRELQVIRLLATGATNRAIATELFLSEKTVARHVANIFLKLDLSSRAAATAFAYEQGLV